MLDQVPSEIREAILREMFHDHALALKDFEFVGGGCINYSGKLATVAGPVFLKWNSKSSFPSMLKAEAYGLDLLRAGTNSFVPNIRLVGDTENYQFLLLEWIAQAPKSPDFSKTLGEKLAALHCNTNHSFGLPVSNYIGSLQQANGERSSWVTFFIEERLIPQATMALRTGIIDKSRSKDFDALYHKLPDLLCEDTPALLHGDLWSGNVITNEAGLPILVDPAVYYGNREVDIAMTRLFGGFDHEFYNAYDQNFPLYTGWRDRIDLYNLYPLLVHVNLFGKAYANEALRIIEAYT
jgi:protein-ribulosamine 3-kinase